MLELLKSLKDKDGFTMKNGKIVEYKTGWQVGICGIECDSVEKALENIPNYGTSFGIWFSDGIYYIDICKRIATKKEALQIAKENNQISIFGWKRKNLVYC